ncbi:hypothetical protein R1sor_020991 [Riccia sorocarpa]|uniref:Pyruvate carboxyltransferase domain-containing protein n=1 Tax=Riccia sorocarpa TaxID=122646 RepID=A0ABD3GIX8_9MARC
MIAKEVGNHVDDDGYVPVICGLSRCNKGDIDAAWEGVRYALRPRIHSFIATSEIHMRHKLRKTPEEVIQIASEMVAYARSLGCEDVEFSPEDAGRSDTEFLYRILTEVIKAGATTLNIPDTNDLGLATANTLAGAYNGGRQLEVTINGIGERAGNASLQEVVMAIRCRGNELVGGLYTGINSKHISVASRMPILIDLKPSDECRKSAISDLECG